MSGVVVSLSPTPVRCCASEEQTGQTKESQPVWMSTRSSSESDSESGFRVDMAPSSESDSESGFRVDMSSVAAGSTSQIGQVRCEASAAAGRAGSEADGLRPVVAAVGEAQRACRVRAECERGKERKSSERAASSRALWVLV